MKNKKYYMIASAAVLFFALFLKTGSFAGAAHWTIIAIALAGALALLAGVRALRKEQKTEKG